MEINSNLFSRYKIISCILCIMIVVSFATTSPKINGTRCIVFFLRIGKLWKYFKVSMIKAIWTLPGTNCRQQRAETSRPSPRWEEIHSLESRNVNHSTRRILRRPHSKPAGKHGCTVHDGILLQNGLLQSWVHIKIPLPKKWKNCWHGAPLLTAFICKHLSEHICSICIKGSFFLQGYRVRGTFNRSGLARNWIRLICCLGHAVQLVCAPRIQRGSSASEAFFWPVFSEMFLLMYYPSKSAAAQQKKISFSQWYSYVLKSPACLKTLTWNLLVLTIGESISLHIYRTAPFNKKDISLCKMNLNKCTLVKMFTYSTSFFCLFGHQKCIGWFFLSHTTNHQGQLVNC